MRQKKKAKKENAAHIDSVGQYMNIYSKLLQQETIFQEGNSDSKWQQVISIVAKDRSPCMCICSMYFCIAHIGVWFGLRLHLYCVPRCTIENKTKHGAQEEYTAKRKLGKEGGKNKRKGRNILTWALFLSLSIPIRGAHESDYRIDTRLSM